MSCSSYRAAISRYLDDALQEADRKRLLTHIQACPQCAATLAEYRAMDQVLRRAAGVEARPFRQTPLANSPSPYPPVPVLQSPATALGLVSVGAIMAVLAVFLSGALVLFFSKLPAPAAAPASALARSEAAPPVGTEDNSAKLKLYSNVDAAPARSASRASEETTARGQRPFYLGYRPGGRSDVVPVYTGPSNDLATVYASLGENLSAPSSPLSLSGSLPPGAMVERVMMERAPAAARSYYLEVIFSLSNGRLYRLQETATDGSLPNTAAMTDEGTLLIGGRAWRYGQTGQHTALGEAVHALRSTTEQKTTNLEAAAPLEEMLQVLEHLR